MPKGWTVAGIQKQVKRMRSMVRQEEDRPWATVAPEFERVLQQMSDDDEHAERIVSHVMDTARFCPSVPEFKDFAGQLVARTEEEIRPDPDCLKCNGSGDCVVERGGISGAVQCDCWARRPLPTWAGQGGGDGPRFRGGLQPVADFYAPAKAARDLAQALVKEIEGSTRLGRAIEEDVEIMKLVRIATGIVTEAAHAS